MNFDKEGEWEAVERSQINKKKRHVQSLFSDEEESGKEDDHLIHES